MSQRQRAPAERDIQAAILRYLSVEPRVAWAHRFNTGAHTITDRDASGKSRRRFIRYAFRGCADILGQLASGHFLAIEVKRPGERPSPEQLDFLETVAHAGGLALIAHSIDDVREALGEFHGARSEVQMSLPRTQI